MRQILQNKDVKNVRNLPPDEKIIENYFPANIRAAKEHIWTKSSTHINISWSC